MQIGFRCDIDGTIAEPQFATSDFWETARLYMAAGLVTEEEVQGLQTTNHQRLWLLPQVLLTHTTLPGAIEGLQRLSQLGTSLAYFTVRQALDPNLCKQVHENTSQWLEHHHFPAPRATRFFWDASEKLLACLEAPEPYIALIDDRPAGLLQAYQRIAAQDARQAEEVKKRVILVGFGCADGEQLSPLPDAPRVLPFPGWSHLSELLSSLKEAFIDHCSVVTSTHVPKE